MTAIALPRPSGRRRAAFAHVVRAEARLTWRRPAMLLGGVAVPIVLLVILGAIPAFRERSSSLHGSTLFAGYVPVVAVFAIALVALMALSAPLTSYRELGVLRRLSTTPLPPSWLLAAQMLVQGTVVVATVLAILVCSVAAYGSPAPKSPLGVAVAVVLSIAGLFPLGLLVAAMAKTSTGATVIGRLFFFPMMFFAGLWLPRALMPTVLLDISNYTPLGAAVEAIQDAILHGFPPAAPLLVLVGYAAVLAYVANRLFRWE